MIGVKPVFKDEYDKTSGIIITLKDSDIQKAKDFTNKVIKAKAKERHHKTDSKSVFKRFLTGKSLPETGTRVIKPNAHINDAINNHQQVKLFIDGN